MSRRLIVVFVALASTLALLASGPAAEAATAGVAISNFTFDPSIVKAPQNTTVKWKQQDLSAHTTVSNQAFWDSGNLVTGATFSITADYSGTFPYHCGIHPFMTGQVRVPITAVAAATGGYTIRWSRLTTTPPNRAFDVEIKRPGQPYTSYRVATTTRQAAFKSNVSGTYRFRARARNLTNGMTSDWSPILTLTMS